MSVIQGSCIGTGILQRLSVLRPVGRQKKWRPQGDLNPCRRRERAVSWARLDDGDAVYMARQRQSKLTLLKQV